MIQVYKTMCGQEIANWVVHYWTMFYLDTVLIIIVWVNKTNFWEPPLEEALAELSPNLLQELMYPRQFEIQSWKNSACGGPRSAVPNKELLSEKFPGIPVSLKKPTIPRISKTGGKNSLADAKIFFNCGWPKVGTGAGIYPEHHRVLGWKPLC